MKNLLALIFILIFTTEAFACSWNDYSQSAYNALEEKLVGSWTQSEYLNSHGTRTLTYKKLDQKGKWAMELRVTLYEESDEIYIDEIAVRRSKYKGKGYSTLMFSKLLLDFPHTKLISGAMAWDNEKALKESLRGGDFYLSSREKQEKAIYATPFYKSLERFGFKEWVSSRTTNSEMVNVTLRRVDPICN